MSIDVPLQKLYITYIDGKILHYYKKNLWVIGKNDYICKTMF